MNSELLTRWTAIITNIAIVVGLVFVGLEFRNTTQATEAERIDSILEGSADVRSLIVENEGLAELIYLAYEDPESLSGSNLDRVQHWMLMHYDNFQRTTLAYESGLITDRLYEMQRIGVGFMFSSDVGSGVIEQMRASELEDEIWNVIGESAKQARAYCLNRQNFCAARYEAARG
jgi:hypothetical protein